MRCFSLHRTNQRSRRGATLTLVVFLLPVLFIVAALVINVSYMELVRTELQVTVDAASRAAGRTYALTGDRDQALAAARDIADRNPVVGRVIPIETIDLEFGVSERTDANERYSFTPGGTDPNSVQIVTNSLANGVGGPIQPLFPLFGSSFNFRPVRSAISTQVELDVAVVIDRSGSMAYSTTEVAAFPPAPRNAPPGWNFGQPVPPGARWLDTIAAVDAFVGELSSSPLRENVSLVTYNHNPRIDLPLSDNYASVGAALSSYSAAFQSGGTNIGGGISDGLQALGGTNARPWAAKVIVLMTDGIHNYGLSPERAASSAGSQGVLLYTVTFSDEADQARMQRVAARAGGKNFHAVSRSQLIEAFQSIARQLPTLLSR
jgi:Ca-activated chloride channel homolog